MATTMNGTRGASAGTRSPVAPPSRRAVRVPELVLGVLLVFGFGLAAVVWHTSTTSRRDVVVVARDLHRGDIVTADDLRAEPVGADAGVRLVPWAHRSAYVGRVVTVDLAAGTPLARSFVQEPAVLGPGEGLASLKLTAGAAPALAAGDRVDAVAVPAQGTSPSSTVVVAAGAVVWSVEPVGDSDTSTVVTLRLPLDAARAVSAAAGQLRLVRVG